MFAPGLTIVADGRHDGRWDVPPLGAPFGRPIPVWRGPAPGPPLYRARGGSPPPCPSPFLARSPPSTWALDPAERAAVRFGSAPFRPATVRPATARPAVRPSPLPPLPEAESERCASSSDGELEIPVPLPRAGPPEAPPPKCGSGPAEGDPDPAPPPKNSTRGRRRGLPGSRRGRLPPCPALSQELADALDREPFARPEDAILDALPKDPGDWTRLIGRPADFARLPLELFRSSPKKLDALTYARGFPDEEWEPFQRYCRSGRWAAEARPGAPAPPRTGRTLMDFSRGNAFAHLPSAFLGTATEMRARCAPAAFDPALVEHLVCARRTEASRAYTLRCRRLKAFRTDALVAAARGVLALKPAEHTLTTPRPQTSRGEVCSRLWPKPDSS